MTPDVKQNPPSWECARALAEAQSEFPIITKTRVAKTGSFSYHYADLSDILTAVRPVLRRNGLALTQTVEEHWLISVLMHIGTGQSLRSAVPLAVQGAGPQAMGSALTYARRYGLCLLLGIVADDDDDGHAAQTPAAPEPAATVSDAPTPAKSARVTEKQLARLFAMSSAAGIPKIQVDQRIKVLFNKDSSRDLNRTEYETICEAILDHATQKGIKL